MTNYFERCQHCIPPERHPGCHGTCHHYAEARAKWDADKAKQDEGKELRHYFLNKGQQSNDGLVKYIKKRPGHKRSK